MEKKSIIRGIILSITVVGLWGLELFVISPAISKNRPTQVLIDMITYQVIILITLFGMIWIIKRDGSNKKPM